MRPAFRAVMGVLVAASLAACAGPANTPSTSTTTSKGTTSSPTSPRQSPPTTTGPTSEPTLAAVPVYYVGESQRSFKLFREFRTVSDAGGRAASAVSAMTRVAPLDPDYQTPWRPASRVAVSQRGAALTVDLSDDAFANTNVGSELAATALQQLVYTATAATVGTGRPASTVTILVNGKPGDVWGVARVGSPMTRAPMLDVQAQAWVTSPQQGEVRRAGTVIFTGYGTSFEATFSWAVTDAARRTVAHGSAMGGTGSGGFGALTFSARLGPGTYTVRLATDDPSGGEGRGPATDDKTFTVR